ncbi:MAG: hypothetical protein II820_09490 [Ruminiclostridium sp.]|nr:hypothetical protein [Ruminiclostridium sp.]
MNTTKKISLPPFWAENTVPILLSTAVMSAASYIYSAGSALAVFLFTLTSLGFSLLLFALYEMLRKVGKTWLTTIIVVLLLIVSDFLALRFVDFRSITELSMWVLEPSRFSQVHYGSVFAMIMLIGFILISCLYYFTRVRYRKLFLFLICLCPFCLFAKTFTTIPVIYPIVMMTLFFFIMTGNAGKTTGSNVHTLKDTNRGTAMSSLAFVLAVTILASFLPKLDYAPFREQFDEFVTGVTINAAETANFDDFSDTSSDSSSTDDTVVFYFYGANPELVKRQCFNIYDLAENSWGYYGNSNDGNSNWKKFIEFEDPAALYEEAGYTGMEPFSLNCWVRPVSGQVRAIYTPENIKNITLNASDAKIYRTENDEYFLEKKDAGSSNSYQLSWTVFAYDNEFSKMFTDEYAKELAETGTAAQSYVRAKEQAVQYNDTLLSEKLRNSCFSTPDARLRVKSLAEEITAGAETTYDKAAAIVDFFRKGDYFYDTAFTTNDTSPDNFIFNTKRGTCTSYATAMTLMCRELGMTARYCEGFLIQRSETNTGYWYVTTEDAHAFTQVWIDGYGWTSFDPTSNTTDNGYFDMTFIYVGAAAALIALFGVLFTVMRPRIKEARYIHRIKTLRGAAQKSAIYIKINDMINRYAGNSENTMTPTDTAEKCAELFGTDITDFIGKYESSVYGGKGDESENCPDVYLKFAAAYKAKLKEERKRGKK